MHPRPRSVGTEIVFWGMSHSGNHAVLNWLLPQLRGDFVFFRNAPPVDPYAAPPFAVRGPPHSPDVSLISFEDRPLPVFHARWSYPRNGRGPAVRQRRHILLLRDPFNLFASRFASPPAPASRFPFINGLSGPQTFLSYFREVERHTHYLGDDRVVVFYNRFRSCQTYRKQISAALGLPFTDEGLNRVSAFGGQSPEDRLAEGSPLRRTDVRWKEFRDLEEYRALFRSRKLVAAGLKYFPSDAELQPWALGLPQDSMGSWWDEWSPRWLPPVVAALQSSPLFRRMRGRTASTRPLENHAPTPA